MYPTSFSTKLSFFLQNSTLRYDSRTNWEFSLIVGRFGPKLGQKSIKIRFCSCFWDRNRWNSWKHGLLQFDTAWYSTLKVTPLIHSAAHRGNCNNQKLDQKGDHFVTYMQKTGSKSAIFHTFLAVFLKNFDESYPTNFRGFIDDCSK